MVKKTSRLLREKLWENTRNDIINGKQVAAGFSLRLINIVRLPREIIETLKSLLHLRPIDFRILICMRDFLTPVIENKNFVFSHFRYLPQPYVRNVR